MESRRGGRHVWWVLAAGLAALAAYGVVRCWPGQAFEPAPLTPAGPGVAELRQASRDANVVLVVLDAVRADHVGSYGYPRETTPNIDRIAQSSLVFERHFSQSTETKSSTARLLTGQYCDTHLSDGPRPLLKGTFTWEQGLEEAGFRTALFSSNLKASPVFGIGDDFQHIECDRDLEPLVREGERRVLPEALLRAFERWLEENGDSRFFTYLHFMPPHQPYLQPEEMKELFAGLAPVDFEPGGLAFPERVPPPLPPPPALPEWINLYDAHLRYGDWAVGELERLLRESRVLEHTLLTVTSDHGEEFGEHRHVWHGKSVYDEECHIPLLIKFPGGKTEPRRIPGLSQTVDLLPTVFDLLEVSYPREGVQGRSLLPVMAGSTESAHEYVFCRAGGTPSKYLVRSLAYALILYGNGRWRALYDLRVDPKQRKNVIANHREVGEEMTEAFRRFAKTQRRPPMNFLDPNAEMPTLPPAPVMELTPEQEQQLRNLGYLR